MKTVLRTALLAAAPLAARVDRRIDWGVRSQGAALPGVCLYEISGVPQMNMGGPSGWARSRVQIDCWARTFKEADDIADLVGGPRGGMLVGFRLTAGGLRLRTFIIGRRSDVDTDGAGVLHRTSLDALVMHGVA